VPLSLAVNVCILTAPACVSRVSLSPTHSHSLPLLLCLCLTPSRSSIAPSSLSLALSSLVLSRSLSVGLFHTLFLLRASDVLYLALYDSTFSRAFLLALALSHFLSLSLSLHPHPTFSLTHSLHTRTGCASRNRSGGHLLIESPSRTLK